MRAACFLALSLLSALWVAVPGTSAQDNPEATSTMQRQLDNVAHVGSVMVDGDICQRIITPVAKEYMFKVDPHDPWLAGDNYDVDDVAFNSTKKTLIRLSHLTSFASDVNLWMPIDGHPGQIQMIIRNKNEMSQFWHWGDIHQDTPPQMETVLKTGRRVTVMERPGWVSVLAPVYNGLGDIVGVLEAVSRAQIDSHDNVK